MLLETRTFPVSLVVDISQCKDDPVVSNCPCGWVYRHGRFIIYPDNFRWQVCQGQRDFGLNGRWR